MSSIPRDDSPEFLQFLATASSAASPRVAYAFVGCIVPNDPQFRTVAFSAAGQMYQQELLTGLQSAGMAISGIFSVMPIPAVPYPNVHQVWVSGGTASLANGLPVTLMSFLNIRLLKQLWIGIATALHLILWGWRERHARYRVVHTYNLTVPPGLCTLLGARLAQAKAVVSLCDINVPGETVPDKWPWRLDYWLQRKLIQRFDGHTVASDAIAREFLTGRPYVRVEGGVREEVFTRTSTDWARPKYPGRAFVITSVGKLDESNGFLTLLEAFSLLPGDRWRLRIAGAGPLAEQIRQAADRDSRIEYLGFIPFDQVLEMYRDSDVLINMRLTNATQTNYFFPSKAMEYLASGVPVISTSTGHFEEEFGDFSFILREETPLQLAALIRRIAEMDPQERKRMGAKARQYIAAHKTWQQQSRKVAEYIRNVVLGIPSAAGQ